MIKNVRYFKPKKKMYEHNNEVWEKSTTIELTLMKYFDC